jgi:integrase
MSHPQPATPGRQLPRAPPGPQPQLPPHPGGREQEPQDHRGLHRRRPAARQIPPGPRRAAPRRRVAWRAPPGVHRRPARPLEAGDRPHPLPGPVHLLQVGRGRRGPQGNPMDDMRPPQLPEQPVDVVRGRASGAAAQGLRGSRLHHRRDAAIILLLVDTGMRRAECVGMTVDDVDLDQRIVWVLGKGRRPGRRRLAARPPRHLTAICGFGKGIDGAPAAALGWPQ